MKVELEPSLIVKVVPDEVGVSFTFVCVKTTKEVLLMSPLALVTLYVKVSVRFSEPS